jgi:RND family efflux transporter MFP subunit
VTSAEAKLATSRARHSAATDALARTLVRAPFAGIVSARPVNAGDIIESGNVLFELLDPTTMYVEGSVPSADMAHVRTGAIVELSVSGYPGRTFTGRIERVSPAADPVTRQVPVFVEVANGDGRLLAGLFAEGRVAPSVGPALVVPSASVEQNGGSSSVLRFSAGRIERRQVSVGSRDPDGTLVEVRAGLTLGDTVVLGVARSMPSGSAARVAGGKAGGSVVTPDAR